ncbi:MAG: C-GCAxxG-C-C family protein [Eubacteriales bacterium]|nr:C-GCAxxG-C-C family protein [Eubacteriales bacterium]MDD4390078.1 C-GCAxxG-C-C family protein [Eubacteriales bacterium]
MNKKENRINKVKDYHNRKCNCAQAVACAYADMFGQSEVDAFRAMESFGGGMAVKSTCGAVSAMAYIAGLANSDGNLEGPASKQGTYKIMRAMSDYFIEKNKSLICSELKGMDTGVVLATCPACMETAAEAIERYVIEAKDEQ